MLWRTRVVFGTAEFDGAALPRKYISLGGWCGPALMLGKLGLRTESYPFDFSRVTLDGLLHFIEKGFEDGFYPPGPPPYHPECVGPWVLYRGQHTAFAHFDLNDAAVQAHFRAKIRRFDAVLDTPERPVTFFRTVTARHPSEELALASALEAAIAQRNRKLDFRVVFMVHDQGLREAAVPLAALSPRMSLWTLQYRGSPHDTLFDRTHTAYAAVMRHSVHEANWPATSLDWVRWATSASSDVYDEERGVAFCDGLTRTHDVPLLNLTTTRFPWRSHDNLALIDGVASVGGTCVGIGSTQMLSNATTAAHLHPRAVGRGLRKCRYCGDATFHAAGRPSCIGRPFTEEEDQLVLPHLYNILTGSDKVATVEQLAKELNRSTHDVICRIQYITHSRTKLTDFMDPIDSGDA